MAGTSRALAGLAVMLATATASLYASATGGDTGAYIWGLVIIPLFLVGLALAFAGEWAGERSGSPHVVRLAGAAYILGGVALLPALWLLGLLVLGAGAWTLWKSLRPKVVSPSRGPGT
ncbi:MAG: hypothetical protein QOG31_1611 [Thermoplasmata archaeon]|jgi:hypothetical protein|nr:hypothetical protein [Thermoplasmata archaeon]